TLSINNLHKSKINDQQKYKRKVETGLSAECMEVEETTSPDVLNVISDRDPGQ
ncbi:MAG: hypothetical protein H6R35_550, partial [Bacteroidetes bacterium]|nr:hypothetical protein [Bacteroidota bacterium]